jgi:hypothetical protein
MQPDVGLAETCIYDFTSSAITINGYYLSLVATKKHWDVTKNGVLLDDIP